MKSVEERLKDLPRIAEESGLEADEKLKRKILRAAEGKAAPAGGMLLRRLAPALCALVVLLGAVSVALPALRTRQPQPTAAPLMDSHPAGDALPGDKLALDVPAGSITIRASHNPSFRSIWAPQTGANFPLIGVNGRYYRMLTNPTGISGGLLGQALGRVDVFTSEPALAGRDLICSNVVMEGETVFAVNGMNGALTAANVNGQMRVFQRVSFGESALVGNEGLGDTLRASSAVALELSGVGTVNDPGTARRLIQLLVSSASFVRSGAAETNQSLLIQLDSGIVLQMAVNGERLIACGTWACPEFFDAFQEALQ